jgi:CubicO group peptidase (beta-lactamase class C family)
VDRSTSLHSVTGGTFDYGYMWWVGDPLSWAGNEIYAALGGSGQAIFVLPDLDVVITHKVDYDTWGSGWSGVYELVRRIMASKVL